MGIKAPHLGELNIVHQFYKKKKLSKNILIVDGQPGCGKTLFNRIFNSFKNIEIYRYSSEIENISSFYFHNKINLDAAKFFLETYTDETLYSQMMGRNTNFRYSDLSSVFQSNKKYKYFKRIFEKGDEVIPSIIEKYKPILHFATHNLLPRSEILFKTFNTNLKYVNIVRHPVYMVHQQAINHIELKKNSARQLIQTFKYKDNEIPFFWENDPQKYIKISNPFEKAILQMNKVESVSKKIEKKIYDNYKKNFLRIPFELFVLNPYKYMTKVEKFLKVQVDHNVTKTMKKEKVPRSKIIEGRETKIYRKYGWEKGTRNLNEAEEINKKIEFIKNQSVAKKYIEILISLSKKYEQDYLKEILI